MFVKNSNNILYQIYEDGSVYVSFDKHVEYDGKSKTFPSYLVIELDDNGTWKIAVESDKITDYNLQNQ